MTQSVYSTRLCTIKVKQNSILQCENEKNYSRKNTMTSQQGLCSNKFVTLNRTIKNTSLYIFTKLQQQEEYESVKLYQNYALQNDVEIKKG